MCAKQCVLCNAWQLRNVPPVPQFGLHSLASCAVRTVGAQRRWSQASAQDQTAAPDSSRPDSYAGMASIRHSKFWGLKEPDLLQGQWSWQEGCRFKLQLRNSAEHYSLHFQLCTCAAGVVLMA